MQELIKDTEAEVLPALSSDYSPIFFSLVRTEPASKGKGLWKVNNSPLSNEEFVTKMRDYIHLKINEMNHENINDDQIRWEFLKYEVKKFSGKFSKILAKKLREEFRVLENKLKLHEQNLKCFENEDYLRCKLRLEEIYKTKANGVKIRSICNWYENGEKSSKFFLNLEKNCFVQNQIRKLIIEEKELTEQNEINNNIFTFYQNLFSKQTDFKQNDLIHYLGKINLLSPSNGQKLICDAITTEKEIYDALKSMENNKTPGNDWLSKEFYEVFWNDVKIPLLASINDGFIKGELSTSQKQALIKLIEKKTETKDLLRTGHQHPC